jgi:adenine-specific DNA-methyltransferase
MPILDWVGKEKVVNHHQEVPYMVMDFKYSFNENEISDDKFLSENKLIKGDNLEALKSLLPQYENNIKLAYCDTVYNTGNEQWVYNDNVNHPKIKKWLGNVVGPEGEDLSRHDKWLCMMYPRLKLIHKLLSNEGFIFCSIDDNSQAIYKLMCDEIFGSNNFIACLPTIMNLKGNQDQFGFAGTHEYTLVYAKNKKECKFNEFDIDENEVMNVWDIDSYGYYKKGASLRASGVDGPREKRQQMYFPFLLKNNKVSMIKDAEYEKIYNSEKDEFDDNYVETLRKKYEDEGYEFILPISDNGVKVRWRWGWNNDTKRKVKNGEILIVRSRNNISLYKKQRPELGDLPTRKPKTLFYKPEYSSGNGTELLKKIFKDKVFENPKPLQLMKDFIHIATDDGDIVLDPWAGSGTISQAILEMNKENNQDRKFILIEMEDYAESITAERIKKVIKGFADNEGTGGNFSFYEIGQPLLINNEYINENLEIDKIRDYIFFTETRNSINKEKLSTDNKYFLGENNNAAYYFYYEKGKISTLNHEFLSTIKTKAETYIIYADTSVLSESELSKYNIVFKKTPRDITRL